MSDPKSNPPPETPPEDPPPADAPGIRRGPVLSVFLVFLGLRLFYALAMFVTGWSEATMLFPAAAVLAIIVVNALRLLAVVAVWRLRRVGVELYVGLALVGGAIKLGAGIGETWYGLVTSTVLLFLVRQKWAGMRRGL